mgnify:FL=1
MKKTTRKDPRKTAIQIIHIAKSQLGLDDDTYRQMLNSTTCKNSCSKMNLTELQQVLDHLKNKGFKSKASRQHGQRPNPGQNRKALMGKVEALLTDSGLHWNYAHAMAQRMFKVEKVDWLEPDQLHKLVGALAINARRRG